MEETSSKTCAKCDETKPLNEFNPSTRGAFRRTSMCADCIQSIRSAPTHCTVVFSDGVPCDGVRKSTRFGGICDSCRTWSRTRGYTTPHGRDQRKYVVDLCSTVYQDETPCTGAAQTNTGLCTLCTQWSKRNGGEDPQGRINKTHTQRPCSVCGKQSIGQSLCEAHYRRNRRYGDPLSFSPGSKAKAWDAFYVVTDGRDVKFGATGRTDQRLKEHARDRGLTEVLRLVTDLPEGAAKWMEDQCKAVLREEGAVPVLGHEQFDAGWAQLITDIVDRFS